MILERSCSLSYHDILLFKVSASNQFDLFATPENIHQAFRVRMILKFRIEIFFRIFSFFLGINHRFFKRWHKRGNIFCFIIVGSWRVSNYTSCEYLSSIICSSSSLCHLSYPSLEEISSCFITSSLSS
jgi:hypothetical protein